MLALRVEGRTEEADGICSFELVDPSGQALPAFEPGAHIDVHVAPGLVRQYSLCGAPWDNHRWRIAVLREPASRGGSAGVHERLRPGAAVTVSAPRNHFTLVASPRTLLLAGGIGITPLLAMAQALQAKGQDFALHYCARTPARMAFRREIESSAFAGKAQLYFSEGEPQQGFDAAQVLADPAPQTQLYVCGPLGFMDHVLETARGCGWPEAQLHREYFAGAVADASGDQAFEVRLARSGRSCQVPPGRSVLQVLLEQGVDVPYGCEAGVCGACLTRVLEGEPDHRDSYLTDAERAANDQFTPCCSRARGPLLLLDL